MFVCLFYRGSRVNKCIIYILKLPNEGVKSFFYETEEHADCVFLIKIAAHCVQFSKESFDS